jgi:hypothetical protein
MKVIWGRHGSSVGGMNEVMSTRVLEMMVCGGARAKLFLVSNARSTHDVLQQGCEEAKSVARMQHIRGHPELYVPTIYSPCPRFMIFGLRAFGI